MHPDATIAVISLTAIGVSLLSALITKRKRLIAKRENEAFREYFISWGDMPFVPKGLRLSGRQPGGGQSLTREPVTVDVRTHRGTGK